MLRRDVAEPPARRPEEVEADDLEDPLSLPRVDVPNVTKILHAPHPKSRLLDALTRGGLGRRFSWTEVALGQGPDALLAGRPDRRDVPGAAEAPEDDTAGRELALHHTIVSIWHSTCKS